MIIGINGYMGSGKDTVGRMIQYIDSRSNASFEDWSKPNLYRGYDISPLSMYEDEKNSWQIKKFAGKLKEIASLMTGIPIEKFEDQEFKKTNMSEEWNNHGMPMTVRQFLQKLGTDAIRDGLHSNAWVNSLLSDYQPFLSRWIITDTRFPNEGKSIKERGGIIIKVNRPSLTSTDRHISETALDDWEFDEVIENDNGLDKLLYLTEQILIKHKLI